MWGGAQWAQGHCGGLGRQGGAGCPGCWRCHGEFSPHLPMMRGRQRQGGSLQEEFGLLFKQIEGKRRSFWKYWLHLPFLLWAEVLWTKNVCRDLSLATSCCRMEEDSTPGENWSGGGLERQASNTEGSGEEPRAEMVRRHNEPDQKVEQELEPPPHEIL